MLASIQVQNGKRGDNFFARDEGWLVKKHARCGTRCGIRTFETSWGMESEEIFEMRNVLELDVRGSMHNSTIVTCVVVDGS